MSISRNILSATKILIALIAVYPQISRGDLKFVECKDAPGLDTLCFTPSKSDLDMIKSQTSAAGIRAMFNGTYAQAEDAWRKLSGNKYAAPMNEAQRANADKCLLLFTRTPDGSTRSNPDPVAALKCAQKANLPENPKSDMVQFFYSLGFGPMLKRVCEDNRLDGCPTKTDIADKQRKALAAAEPTAGSNLESSGGTPPAQANNKKSASEGSAGSSDKASSGTKSVTSAKLSETVSRKVSGETDPAIVECLREGVFKTSGTVKPDCVPTEGFPEIKGLSVTNEDFLKVEAARAEALAAAAEFFNYQSRQPGMNYTDFASAAGDFINTCKDEGFRKSIMEMSNAWAKDLKDTDTIDAKFRMSDISKGYVESAVKVAKQASAIDEKLRTLTSDFSRDYPTWHEKWQVKGVPLPCASVIENAGIIYANATQDLAVCSDRGIVATSNGTMAAKTTSADKMVESWPNSEDGGVTTKNVNLYKNEKTKVLTPMERCKLKDDLIANLQRTKIELLASAPELSDESPNQKAGESRLRYQDVAAAGGEEEAKKVVQQGISKKSDEPRVAALKLMLKARCDNPLSTGAQVFADDQKAKEFISCSYGADHSSKASENWSKFLDGEKARCAEIRKMGPTACVLRERAKRESGSSKVEVYLGDSKALNLALPTENLKRDVYGANGVLGQVFDREMCFSLVGGVVKTGVKFAKAGLEGALKEAALEAAKDVAKSIRNPKPLLARAGMGVAGQFTNPLMVGMLATQAMQIHDAESQSDEMEGQYWAKLTTADKRNALVQARKHGYLDMARDVLVFGVMGGVMHSPGEHNILGEDRFMNKQLTESYNRASAKDAIPSEKAAYEKAVQNRIAERMGVPVGDLKPFFEKLSFDDYRRIADLELKGEAQKIVGELDRTVASKGQSGKAPTTKDLVAAAMKHPEWSKNPEVVKQIENRALQHDSLVKSIQFAVGSDLSHADASVFREHLAAADVTSENLGLLTKAQKKELATERDKALRAILAEKDPSTQGKPLTDVSRVDAVNKAKADLAEHYLEKIRFEHPKSAETALKKFPNEPFDAYQLVEYLAKEGNGDVSISRFLEKIGESCPTSGAGVADALKSSGCTTSLISKLGGG